MDGSLPGHTPADAAPTSPVMTRHRLTLRDYELMGEIGIFGPEDRVELIDGELIDMAPIGPDRTTRLPPTTSTVSW